MRGHWPARPQHPALAAVSITQATETTLLNPQGCAGTLLWAEPRPTLHLCTLCPTQGWRRPSLAHSALAKPFRELHPPQQGVPLLTVLVLLCSHWHPQHLLRLSAESSSFPFCSYFYQRRARPGRLLWWVPGPCSSNKPIHRHLLRRKGEKWGNHVRVTAPG